MEAVKTTLILLTFVVNFGMINSVPHVGSPPSFLEVGNCAALSHMENFQVEKYLGKWFSTWYVPNSHVTIKSCAVDSVTVTGKKIKVKTRGLTAEGFQGRTQGKLSAITPKNKKKKPYLRLEAPMVPAVPYYIVDTDYTSYSCVYSCYSLLGMRAELFWVYSRTPEISLEAQQKCFDIFKKVGLDMNKLSKVNQEGCDHPPVEIPAGAWNKQNMTESVLEDDPVDLKQVQDNKNFPSDFSDDEDDSEGSGVSASDHDADPHQRSQGKNLHIMPGEGAVASMLGETIIEDEVIAIVEFEEIVNSKDPQASRGEHNIQDNAASTTSVSSLLMCIVIMLRLLLVR